MRHAFISIHQQFVKDILAKTKSVEIRSRKVTIPKGAWLWIYATLPSGKVEAVATVKKVRYTSATEVWNRYSNKIAITREQLFEYSNGNDVSAIELENVRVLSPKLPLIKIREAVPGFRPPQFFTYVDTSSAMYKILAESTRRAI